MRIPTRLKKIDEAELKSLKRRIDITTLIIIALIAVLVSRLWFLQIYKGDEYSRMSESNRIRGSTIAAPRGNILDRNGSIMVTNRPQFNVVWIREDAPNPDEVIKKVAKILDTDISDILQKIRKAANNPRYMPIRLREDIDWKTLVYIENHQFDLPGIRIEVLPTRDYLFGNIASHLIGYLGEINREELQKLQWKGYQGGDLIGKMGVEKLFEDHLHGEKGRKFVEVDALGFQQKLLDTQEPLPGNDIYLTIDAKLQQAAEDAMGDKAGAVVAMEVNSGKILALVSTPPLPLNEFVGGISSTIWKSMLDNPLHPLLNKTIQGQYPPGSTYKIVTALAALSEGAITPKTVYYCSGSLRFGNKVYGCWKEGGHGAVSLLRALAESCDVYFYHASIKIGIDTIAEYATSMGLGSKTGINLEHEKSGLIPTSAWKKQRYKESWQEGETLSASIGQGFDLTTPLQVCMMTAATVNGGILYRPQFIEKIEDPEGKNLFTFSPIVGDKIKGSDEALRLIRDALVAAVNNPRGTGQRARLKTITVGGKTGTAQVVRLALHKDVEEEEIPYKYRDHAWFSCFAPAEKPEIALSVLVEHGGHGGAIAGPIAKKILKQYFNITTQDTEQPLTVETD